mgnify:CR=1 FL=1
MRCSAAARSRVSVAAIFLLYRYLPNHEVRSRQVPPAAIAAGVVARPVRLIYLRVLPLLDLPKSQGPYYVSMSFALLAYFEAFVLLGGRTWPPGRRRVSGQAEGVESRPL